MQQHSRYLKPVEGDGGEEGGAPESIEEEVDPSAGMSQDDINDLLDDEPAEAEEEDSPPAESPDGEEAAPEEESEEEAEPESDETPIDDPQPVAEQEVEERAEPEAEAPQEETPEALQAKKDEWLGKLADQYSISDEDAEALVTEPETVLPRLAANIHAAVLVDMAKAVEQMLPQMMGQFIQTQPQLISTAMQSHQKQADAKTEFYNNYPALKGNEETVKIAATTVAQNFPNLSEAEQLAKVGQISLAMLGITPQPQAPQQQQEPAPAPFTPAKSGSAPPSAPTDSGNVWDEFLS